MVLAHNTNPGIMYRLRRSISIFDLGVSEFSFYLSYTEKSFIRYYNYKYYSISKIGRQNKFNNEESLNTIFF